MKEAELERTEGCLGAIVRKQRKKENRVVTSYSKAPKMPFSVFTHTSGLMPTG